jgi:hypothetical protein
LDGHHAVDLRSTFIMIPFAKVIPRIGASAYISACVVADGRNADGRRVDRWPRRAILLLGPSMEGDPPLCFACLRMQTTPRSTARRRLAFVAG